jgi:hypothetical protein
MLLLSIAALAAMQAYGPDTCVSGYVWRETTPADHVCVTPDQRRQAKLDNAQARYRVSLVNRAYGEHTCRQGYVWREAAEGDLVCVEPWVRDRVRADNAAAPSRYVNN